MRWTFVVFVLFFVSCKNNSSPVYKRLSGADSLVINFNIPNSNLIDKTISTSEKKAIRKLAGFIDSKACPAYKCGYDGNIIFYDKGAVTGDIAFNYSQDSCRHFIQVISDQLSSTSMSNEASNFLRSLAEGKNWY